MAALFVFAVSFSQSCSQPESFPDVHSEKKSPGPACQTMEINDMPCLLSAFLETVSRAPVFCGRFFAPAVATAILLFAANSSADTLTLSKAGLSAEGTPLFVSAIFTTGSAAGGANSLKITLQNSGSATKFKADVLSSFYFNLANPSGTIPLSLNYNSGTGQAFQVLSGTSDRPVSWEPDLVIGGGTWTTSGTAATAPSNLVAEKDLNEGWQFITTTPPPVPGFRFGIGTVGNTNIANYLAGASPFNGIVVKGVEPESMINLGIYSTGTAIGSDVDPAGSLEDTRLLRTEAVFTFTSDQSLVGFDASWVNGDVAFGFGTDPESVLVPEPGSLSIAALGVALAAGWQVRRRKWSRSCSS